MDGIKARHSTLVFFTLLFLVLCSCSRGCRRIDPSSPVPVTVEPVKTQQSSPTVIVAGILIPRDRVDVKVSRPAKVSEVYANKGDTVAQGTPLAKFAEDELNLQLNQMRSARKELETLLERNSGLLKGHDRLLEEGKIDKTQYDGLSIEVASNETALNKIKADTDIVEYNLAHIQTTSPIAGVIVEKYISPMQMAAENQTIFVIVNTNPILVSFSLTADESAGVKLGTPLRVRVLDTDEEYSVQITYIGPEIQQPGKTFEVWGTIPNASGTLKVGMQATAEFTSTLIHKVFVAPESALITRNRDKFIYTVVSGIAHLTRVDVRNMHGGIAEISSGLAEGDLIVVKGAPNLQDGAKVEMWRR